MKKRIITGIIMFIVLVPLLIVKELIIGLKILFGVLSIIGSLEMLNMYNKDNNLEVKITTAFFSLFVYLSLILFPITSITISNLSMLGFVILLEIFILLILSTFNNKFNNDTFLHILTSSLYVSLGLGSLVMLRINSVMFVLLLLLTTSLTDIFAYAVGMNFGKHKMAPNISPNKSWEGAIGGTFIAVKLVSLFSIFYGNIFTGSYLNEHGVNTIIDTLPLVGNLHIAIKSVLIILLVLLISVVGQTGDLVASKMKRTYDIKDFGNVFPGHGGVLDRLDSAIFSSIFLVIIIITLGLF